MGRIHISIIFILQATLTAYAANNEEYYTRIYPRTFIAVGQNIYSGSTNTSFGQSGLGYRLSLQVLSQGKYLIPFFSSSFLYMQSRQSFLDGSTSVTTNFNYYGGEGNIGFRYYPLVRERDGFNPYVLVGGIVGYNIVQLSQSATLTTIDRSSQSFSAGYSAGIGVEWIFDRKNVRKSSLMFQFQYNYSTSTLFTKQFDLSHGAFSIGYGW